MDNVGRDGHRKRMRELYMSGGLENAPDHNLLELFLSIIIPRKDVKQLSYDLINHYGSLDAVFSADVQSLMKVKGVGESTAVAISLSSFINKRIMSNRNSKIKKFDNDRKIVEFCENKLRCESTEKVLEITLNNSLEIINTYIVGNGGSNSVFADSKNIVYNAVKDKASFVVISHNHPFGSENPSQNDIDFTIEIKFVLAKIGIRLLEHVIVGKEKSHCIGKNSFMLK